MYAFMASKAGNQVAYLCLQQVRKPQNPQEDWILGASDASWTWCGPLLDHQRRFCRAKKNNHETYARNKQNSAIFGILRISIYLNQDSYEDSSCVAGKTYDGSGQTMGQALIGVSHGRAMD